MWTAAGRHSSPAGVTPDHGRHRGLPDHPGADRTTGGAQDGPKKRPRSDRDAHGTPGGTARRWPQRIITTLPLTVLVTVARPGSTGTDSSAGRGAPAAIRSMGMGANIGASGEPTWTSRTV